MCREKGISVPLKKILAVYSVIFGMILPLRGEAAAWLEPKGDGLIIGNIQPYTSCHYWNQQGNLQSGPCFYQFAVNPYMEYGVTSKFTAILNPTFLSYSQLNQKSHFALGYATIGGRFLISKKDYNAFSFQVLYNQPFKSENFGNGLSPSTQYTIANEQRYADFRFLYGTGGKFDPKEYNTWYADIEASYNPYFNGGADQLHFDLMFGWKTLAQRLIFEVQELNAISLHNPLNSLQPNYSLCSIIPNIRYLFKSNWSIQVGVKQDFYGTNVGMGTSPFAALWFVF